MRTFQFAIKRLFKKGEHSITRIISLVAGLAFGILLLSEVFYYQSYDSFYPDADQIYVVNEKYKHNSTKENWEKSPYTSGAVAPALKKEIPGIEGSCRLIELGNSVLYSNDLKSYKGKFVLAEGSLFDVLPLPVIKGDPKEILSSPMKCMISDKIAEKMGGNVLGKTIELKDVPGKILTIAGIFKALPENTFYPYDILVSMESIGEFTWDGRENWIGNDRYFTCVKLEKGINPESLAPAVRKMQQKYQDIDKVEQESGIRLKYTFQPITKLYSGNVRNMSIIITIIAFAVLFVSVMNYILLTLNTLIKRAKSYAIHKSCGAQTNHILKMIFSESAILFVLSLAGAILCIVLFKPWVENQTGHQLTSILTIKVILPIVLFLVLILLIMSLLPGYFFSKIPIATTFRTYQQKKNKWKLGLLALQFTGASFILIVLVIISLQYKKMSTADHGYRAKQIYYSSTSGMDGNKMSTVLDNLRSMPEVEKVAIGYGLPIEGASGNNIYSQDRKKELFNVADFYFIDENYLSLLEIPVVQGHDFSTKTASIEDVMISEKCAELLQLHNGWKDGVVGKTINITEHDQSTIRGVYPDFVIKSIADPDNRPSVFFFVPQDVYIKHKIESPESNFYIMVKVNKNNEAGIQDKLSSVFNLAIPHNDAEIFSLENEQLKSYKDTNSFRHAMLAGNIIIILITLLGLLGYTSNEAGRRTKELAIRKINGANFTQVLLMFLKDILLITIPSIILGATSALFIAKQWMQNFASKIELSWFIFTCCSLVFLLLITIITIFNYTRMINNNPVEALRNE